MPEPEPARERAAAPDEAAVLNDFLARLLRDREAGRQRELADYQALWPSHRERIAAEFAELTSTHRPALPAIPQVQLERVIGRGGQATVYRGRQDYVDRTVAVKVMKTTFAAPSFAGRFRREARALAGLTHANIVTCYQAGVTDDGTCYIVMEFVDGPTLRHWLDRGQRLSPTDAIGVVRELAGALEHALAAGVIHRDVKAENVLLQPDARGGEFPFRPKLVDLGLARAVVESGMQTAATPLGALLGTPRTMAPEQFALDARVDHRADIYGLGCLFYHALTGKPAFGEHGMTKLMAEKDRCLGPDPRALVPSLPMPLANLVMRMTAKAPSDRPQTYTELRHELDRAVAPSHPRATNRRKLRLGIVVMLLLAVAAVAWWMTRP